MGRGCPPIGKEKSENWAVPVEPDQSLLGFEKGIEFEEGSPYAIILLL
jgi:hypothetical protein